ncbi:hypothetical protein B0H10DRAFT_2245994 [Mycena sp. CBHHK59/15]|nr:hypothetical protein B0H10DRAFT_2245994 [Mycena sp. CBHHK59/15]
MRTADAAWCRSMGLHLAHLSLAGCFPLQEARMEHRCLNLNGLPNEDDDPGNSDEPPSIRDDLPVDSGPVPVPEDDNDKDEDDDGSKSDSEDESDDEMEEEPELEGDDDDDDSGMDGGDDEDIDLFDDEGFLDV